MAAAEGTQQSHGVLPCRTLACFRGTAANTKCTQRMSALAINLHAAAKQLPGGYQGRLWPNQSQQTNDQNLPAALRACWWLCTVAALTDNMYCTDSCQVWAACSCVCCVPCLHLTWLQPCPGPPYQPCCQMRAVQWQGPCPALPCFQLVLQRQCCPGPRSCLQGPPRQGWG